MDPKKSLEEPIEFRQVRRNYYKIIKRLNYTILFDFFIETLTDWMEDLAPPLEIYHKNLKESRASWPKKF